MGQLYLNKDEMDLIIKSLHNSKYEFNIQQKMLFDDILYKFKKDM